MNQPSDSKPDLQSAFETNTVWNADASTLQEYLRQLNSDKIINSYVQHRAVVRALTINHIQLTRLIHDLDKRNNKTQLWFMILAIGSLLIGLLGVIFH
ncbi:MAG: hypothetical protein BGO12_13025 [Verrucomicrobia bacterium 61-8]|nr:MAG: hypothetical protein BGO12_13025 [Verrucomicrobia bacterium 61-8]